MSYIDKVFKKRLQNALFKIISDRLSIDFQKQTTIREQNVEFASETLRLDFVFEVTRKGQKETWHIEEQTQDDKNMIERMLKYFALLYDKYKVPVYQVVLFVGKSKEAKSKMEQQKILGFFEYAYKLINLSEIAYTEFLKSPETLPFAILGKYQDKEVGKVLQQIGEKSKKFLKKRDEFTNLVNDLALLSKQRNLEKEVLNLIDVIMPLLTDYKETEFFKEGKKEGKEEGKKEGKKETAKALIILGDLSLEKIAQVTDLTLKQIKELELEIREGKKK